MFRRLAAFFVFGMAMAGGAFGQAMVCSIDNNFTGVFDGDPGSYTVIVGPNANATLRASCTSDVNSYNWNPGAIQTSQIAVTAPGTPGNSISYALTGCNSVTFICATPVTITIQVASTAAPDCTLTASPNPAVSGQTVTFSASCDSSLPPPAQISYTDLSGTNRTSASLTFADTAPAVTSQSVRNVFYHGIASGGASGALRVLLVTINPIVVPPPSGCTVTAAPNPITLGTSSVLTGQCTGGGPATQYSFTAPDGSVSNGPPRTLTVTPATVGNHTFTFVARNSTGDSLPATVTIVVQPAVCNIAASIPNPVQRNASVTLTASCNNQPVLFSWSSSAGQTSLGTLPTLIVAPSVTTTYTITASNASTTLPVVATGQYTVVVSNANALAAVAGGPLTGTPGRPLSRAMQVRATDATGSPVAQELVNWSVVNPGSSPGSFASTSGATDAQGFTSNTFAMGTDAGGRTLRACLAALPAVCADFQVLPGASAIASIVGATITGTPGRPLSSELQVRVADPAGVPVAGELVNWSVVNPGSSPGTFAANPSPASDAQGITRNTFTMGNDAGGRTLRACLSSLPTVCVDFQVVVGASGLVAIAGSPLVGAPGRPLSREMQVRATNAQGVPIPQEIVNWTVVNPGANPGSFAANPSAPTDAQGLTRNSFTMGNDAGGRTLRACLATLPSVCVDFVVRSLNDAVERPAAKIMSPMAELAVATPLAQLSNVRFRLEQLRLRRNPSVVEALRVSVAGRSLPSFSAFALAPLDKNGKPVPQKGGGAAADDPFERLGFFVNGDVEIGRQSGTAVQNGYDLNTKGLTVGADYRLPGESVVGLAAGFMKANTDLAEAGGSQGGRGYSLSAYGSFVPATGMYIDVIAHAGSNKYDTQRRELTDASLPVEYNGNTKGNQYALAISAGADFNRGPLTMNPYLRMDYVNAKINGFSESGNDGAIKVGDLDLKTTVVTLGGQLSYAISTSWGVLSPNTRLELQRRIQGDGRNVNAQLVADPTVNALVPLESVDKNYGNVSLGVSAVLPRGVSGFANYERLFGREGYSNSKYTVGVRFEF